MSDRPKLVITGAAGRVGSVLGRGLRDRFDVVGVDLRPAEPGFDVRQLDASRLRPLTRVMQDAEIVVALTTDRRIHRSPRVLYSSELPAMETTLQAAADVGARRVVLASSNQVMAGYEGDHPYSAILAGHYEGLDPDNIRRLTVDDAPRPVMPYDVGKLAAEALARQYSERGLSVVCLRLGSITGSGRPQNARHFASLLTHGDLVRLVEAAIDADDDLRFGVFFGVSDNTWRTFDISDANERLGYHPADNAENWRRDPAGRPRAHVSGGDTRSSVHAMLLTLGDHDGGLSGNRLDHSLKTATRAERDGADEDWVLAALCHDIGSTMRGGGHGRVSAEILRPFVRPQVAWSVSVHEDFTLRRVGAGRARHKRYIHAWRPHYRKARRFADDWDLGAFDHGEDFLPLAHFEPLLDRMFAEPRHRLTWTRRAFESVTRPVPPRIRDRVEHSLLRVKGRLSPPAPTS